MNDCWLEKRERLRRVARRIADDLDRWWRPRPSDMLLFMRLSWRYLQTPDKNTRRVEEEPCGRADCLGCATAELEERLERRARTEFDALVERRRSSGSVREDA